MKALKWVSTLVAAASLTACGGGSSSSTAVPLTGNISTGLPVAGASVTIMGSKGNVIDNVTADASGDYSVADISSLTAPLLIKGEGTVEDEAVTYYSALASINTSNNANVTPITDSVVALAAGVSPAALEADITKLAALSESDIDNGVTIITNAFTDVMNQIENGSATNFNPITTKFKADGISAADRINDLFRIISTLTSNGMTITISDNSGSVGSIDLTSSSEDVKIPNLPDYITDTPRSEISDFFKNYESILSTEAGIDGTAIEEMFATDFMKDGRNKAARLEVMRNQYRNYFLGIKLGAIKKLTCDSANECRVWFKAITTAYPDGSRQDYDVRKNPSTANWELVGNGVYATTWLNSAIQKVQSNSMGNTTYKTQLDLHIDKKNSTDYTYAKASFQRGESTPDLVVEYEIDSTCFAGYGSRTAYYGLSNTVDPITNETYASGRCRTWIDFDNENQSTLQAINEKIMQGNYVVKLELRKNKLDSTNTDTQYIKVTRPFLTTARVTSESFPQVEIVQGDGQTFSHLKFNNYYDFSMQGSLCISASEWCSPSNPEPITTTSKPKVLPFKYFGETDDGWTSTTPAVSYYVNTVDRFGNNLMVNRH